MLGLALAIMMPDIMVLHLITKPTFEKQDVILADDLGEAFQRQAVAQNYMYPYQATMFDNFGGRVRGLMALREYHWNRVQRLKFEFDDGPEAKIRR